jgi:phosphoglycerol transferase
MDATATLTRPAASGSASEGGREAPAPRGKGWFKSELTRELCTYAAAILFCVLFLTWLWRLWDMHARVPFLCQGDALVVEMIVKTLAENPWYLTNDRVGAPFGLELHDFPLADNLHFGLLKLITLAFPNPFAACNLYFLLTYPLTVLTGLFVLRHFGVSRPTAAVVSLLYAFLPYHVVRGIGHLPLAAYYCLPLAVMVALWVALDQGPFFRKDPLTGRWAFRPWGRRALAGLAVCLLLSANFVYYSYFTCYLLAGAGLLSAVRRRCWRPLAEAGLLVAVIGLGTLANLAPSLLYTLRNGPNTDAAARAPIEAEVYSLKLSHLVLPTPYHRVGWVAERRRQIDSALGYTGNEAALSSSLGLFGGAGLVVLLGWVFVRRGGRPRQRLLTALSSLNLLALLLATTGGLSALFAVFVSPSIRAYCRISVIIAFLALFALALILDWLRERWQGRRLGRYTYLALAGAVLTFGLLDQTGANTPDYRGMRELIRRDGDYVRRVEASVPAGSLIYQLPFARFPEFGPVGAMQDYDHFLMYLHSKTLRWSYGAMRGRRADQWQQVVAALYPEDQLRVLSHAGFRGVHVDRLGYADRAAALGARLQQLLGVPPLVSADGRYAYYDMGRFNDRLRAGCSARQLRARRDAALNLVYPDWRPGFSSLEVLGPESWRWCSKAGDLVLENLSSQPRQVTLEFATNTGHPGASRLALSGPLLKMDLAVSCRPTKVRQELQVPPGRHAIHFACDAPVASTTDARAPVFRITEFVLRQVE